VGIGIDADTLPNIFNLFVQADTTLARSRGGLGIGLSVVKRIIDLHGGTVKAASAGPGEGSEFTVTLPVSQTTSPAMKSSVPSHKETGPRRRILVVDDNVDAAMTISSLLKAWGHEVLSAYNGPSALETVRSFRPEFILLDIGLPGMSGYDVARLLRAEPSMQGAVIAALTGYGQESDRQRSLDAGFDYHLTKPADLGLLESLLTSPRIRDASRNARVENN
jgi:CheY-like chemotaxis protein